MSLTPDIFPWAKGSREAGVPSQTNALRRFSFRRSALARAETMRNKRLAAVSGILHWLPTRLAASITSYCQAKPITLCQVMTEWVKIISGRGSDDGA